MTVEIYDYDPAWAQEFRDLGSSLRNALGDVVGRIDHIGSTAVLGLAAKPVIDIQISVASLEPVRAYLSQLEGLGYVWREDNPEKTKRYFRETLGLRRTHLHVRQRGSWHEQYALLFRDYLRQHAEDCCSYETVKRTLAARYADDRYAYTEAKSDIFWEIIRRADRWAAATGWAPGPSDA